VARPSPGRGETAGSATTPGPSVGSAPVAIDPALRGIINLPPPPTAAAAASAPVGGTAAAVPPAVAAPGRLNLDLSRRPGALPPAPVPLRLTPPPADPKTRLARDIEKAGKADCRTAHADKGVLAAPAIAADALGKDGGCKW
jgi:hypothetical protein